MIERSHCRYCARVFKWATWVIETDCACTGSIPVCSAHMAKGVRELSGRDDNHMGKEKVTVRPLDRR